MVRNKLKVKNIKSIITAAVIKQSAAKSHNVKKLKNLSLIAEIKVLNQRIKELEEQIVLVDRPHEQVATSRRRTLTPPPGVLSNG